MSISNANIRVLGLLAGGTIGGVLLAMVARLHPSSVRPTFVAAGISAGVLIGLAIAEGEVSRRRRLRAWHRRGLRDLVRAMLVVPLGVIVGAALVGAQHGQTRQWYSTASEVGMILGGLLALGMSYAVVSPEIICGLVGGMIPCVFIAPAFAMDFPLSAVFFGPGFFLGWCFGRLTRPQSLRIRYTNPPEAGAAMKETGNANDVQP